ncbi:carbohydrate ABC transporter permease [Cohnella luojiensis]|uniref:Sugar ABC transporter permease n=1 Tax=Cohnella luojiensis TaxID=652876 RepID=A0A4Y8LP72_9BACL|nr:sugar ABC transporter permease [Cohnella luojiensis]TFE22809.1 sugar ABC transporter permease [Cohnella luojiensis]
MRNARRKDILSGYLFILPGLIGFSLFVGYPLIVSIYYSMTEWSGFNTPKYIGFENFNYLFNEDPTFYPSLKSTFLYVITSVPLLLICGLLLALLLNKQVKGIRIFRTLFYLPVVLPTVAVITLWGFVYNPQFGLANQVLGWIGLPSSDWLSGEHSALFSLIVMSLWGVGGTMIIFLGGLQSVPKDLYEASEVDGASSWRKFWSITLPMITPILFLQFIIGLIASFQIFEQAQILTDGGPGFATYFLNFSIYKSAFNENDFGYAIAKVWVLFFIVMAFTVVSYRFANRHVYYENED